MGTFSAILCGREITFIFLGLSVGALIGSAQREVPVEFQQCVTSCIDSQGYSLNSGNYPYCDHCNDFIQCFSGNMAVQHCPFGTNYFNRKLGVCDSDMSVCVNDSLSTTTTTTTTTTTPTTTTTTPTPPTTTTNLETTSSTVGLVTTSQTLNTTTSILTTASTPTTTTTTLPTTTTAPTTTTTALPTTPTTIISTSTPLPTTTSTIPTILTTSTVVTTTTTVIPGTNSPGYKPRSGEETDVYLFAIDLYNNNSRESMRASGQNVDSLTAEKFSGTSTYYRVYGVMLMQTVCPNKPEFTKADSSRCPLMSPAPGSGNQYFMAKCDFKVRYVPSSTTAVKLDMMYMMCSK